LIGSKHHYTSKGRKGPSKNGSHTPAPNLGSLGSPEGKSWRGGLKGVLFKVIGRINAEKRGRILESCRKKRNKEC